MLNRIFGVIFSIVGISATFMPWLHYPVTGDIFYGYMGDGIITGFLFFLILTFSVFSLIKNKTYKITNIVIGVLGILFSIYTYFTIEGIHTEQINFTTDNPLIAAGTAGFYEGAGIYLIGFAGLGLFINSIIGFLTENQIKPLVSISKADKSVNVLRLYFFGFGLIIILSIVGFYFLKGDNLKFNTSNAEQVLTEKIENMNQLIQTDRFVELANFTHPLLVQTIGGKEKTIEVLRKTSEEWKKDGLVFENVSILKILDVIQKGRIVQVLFTQQVQMSKNMLSETENQQVIAVSEDQGKTWYFININGKSKEEMKKIFPPLFDQLEFK